MNVKQHVPVRGANRRRWVIAVAAVALAALRLPAITVLSPNGGEDWAIGDRVAITWTATAAGESVRLTLYRGGLDDAHRLGHIVNATPGATGSYSWSAGEYIGGRAGAGEDYFVRVRVEGTAEADFSDSAFTLLGAITVSSPGETAVYEASTSDMRVAWTATDVGGSVRIDLERQDGAERYVISDSVAVGGSPVTWPVPLGTAAGTYRVRVSQGATAGISGRCFIMAYRPPSIAVLQPNGGEEIPMGGSYPIRWQPHHLEGDLRLELLKDGRLVGVLSGREPVGGMCSYDWDAKTCEGRELLPGRGFKVRVTTLDGLHTDTSDASFALAPRPSIALYRPNSGETWIAGASEEIRWTFMKMDGYTVTLNLEFPDPSRTTGSGGFAIADGVPATDGRFSWRVGTLRNAGDPRFPPGTQSGCVIFLRATKGSSVYWHRSKPFKIQTVASKKLIRK